MAQVSINYLAVLVSAIVSMVIGALWYSPVLFGKVWMKYSNIDQKKISGMKKSGKVGKSYFFAFAGTLVMAYVLAHFVDYADATTIAEGMQAGFWIWLGFIATTTLSSVLWAGKSVKLYFLDNGHYLVSLLVMGAILAVWV